jgi:hypothetical protein
MLWILKTKQNSGVGNKKNWLVINKNNPAFGLPGARTG